MAQAIPDSLKHGHELLQRSMPKAHIIEGTDLTIVEVWKAQLLALLETQASSPGERAERLISDTYVPYPALWASYFFGNVSEFSKWATEALPHLLEPSHPAWRFAFELEMENLLLPIASRTGAMLGRRPEGIWHLFYGPHGDMGGTPEGIVWANLRVIADEREPMEYLRFLLPHELSHLVLWRTLKALPPIEAFSLLHLMVIEGVCCYFSYKYWECEHAPSKNTLFSEEDWRWCVTHERQIVRQAITDLGSSSWRTLNAYHRAGMRPWPDAPSRLAYFIGFRICETYVREHGPESWKEIYHQPVEETLTKSRYLESLELA